MKICNTLEMCVNVHKNITDYIVNTGKYKLVKNSFKWAQQAVVVDNWHHKNVNSPVALM